MKTNTKMKKFVKNFKRDWQLHLIILFPAVYLILFDFLPMYGIQIAFRDYRPKQGITGSEWVGWKWFIDFFAEPEFGTLIWNTFAICIYWLATFPLPIIFALIINALRSEKFSKTVKTVSYMPHFISLPVMIGIIFMLLSPTSGLYGAIYGLLTGHRAPDIRYLAENFRHLYIWSGVWQGLGWSSIIYVSALSGVSQELHEAAMLDGATRMKRMWYIDIPTIMPTIAILFIMQCTSLLSVGFEKVYLMQRPMNKSVSSVLSTYIFEKAIGGVRSYSYGAAVGLWNSAINLTVLILVNAAVRKATDNEISLY